MHTVRTLLVLSILALAAQPVVAQYQEVAVTNGGTIIGHVRVSGEIPALPPQTVYKEQATCGTTIPDQRLLVDKSRGLRNAIVSLVDVKAGKPIARDQPVALDNVKCMFVPHVLTASVGQMIEIHNSDPFLHDAQALLGPQTLFNVAVPKGRTVRRPLAYAGLINIICNVRHTWMHAYLFVAEHPYHTVTNANGEFRIDGVPPGTYTLRAWHELLGSVDRPVTVEGNKTATVDVTLQSVAAETP